MSKDMTTQPQERDIEAALEWLRYGHTTRCEHAQVLLDLITRLRAQPSPREVALEKALRETAISQEYSDIKTCRLCWGRWLGGTEKHGKACILSPAQKGEPG